MLCGAAFLRITKVSSRRWETTITAIIPVVEQLTAGQGEQVMRTTGPMPLNDIHRAEEQLKLYARKLDGLDGVRTFSSDSSDEEDN